MAWQRGARRAAWDAARAHDMGRSETAIPFKVPKKIRAGRRNGEPTGTDNAIFADDTAARGYYLESEGVHWGQTPPRETPG